MDDKLAILLFVKIISGLAGIAVVIFGYVAKLMAGMNNSIQELNIKVAVVISELGDHSKRISRLEDKDILK